MASANRLLAVALGCVVSCGSGENNASSDVSTSWFDFAKPGDGVLHVFTHEGEFGVTVFNGSKPEHARGTLDTSELASLEELVSPNTMTHYLDHSAEEGSGCYDGQGYTLELAGRIGCWIPTDVDDAETNKMLDTLVELYEKTRADAQQD